MICYFRALWACQADHPQEKHHDQTVALIDTLLHAKSKLSTSIIFEILKLCSLIAFSIITQELDFSQPCRFHRFSEATMVYHLKPKNHIDGPFFFVENLYCRLWTCSTKH